MPAGDPIYASDFDRPVVRLVQQVAQNLNSGVAVAIGFGSGSEEIDPNGWHDTVTNNSRITPTKAGYYEAVGTVWAGTAVTTTAQVYAGIAKNGTTLLIKREKPDGANNAAVAVQVNMLVAINGTGDYVELIGFQSDTSAGARTTQTGVGTSSVLELRYHSPLS